MARAAELGMDALAVVDHQGLYGAVRFWKAAEAAGVRPVYGVEMTLDDGFNLVLLARDQEGYSNLCRLVSNAQLAGRKGQAALDRATLAAHAGHLHCLTAFRKGEVGAHLLEGRRREALAAARRYARLFGAGALWIELQDHLLPEDHWLVDELVEVAERLGLGCVATNNVHYAHREGHRLQDVLVCIANRTTLDQSSHLRFPNAEYYLKSAQEMGERFARYPGALANTHLVADACRVELGFERYRFPGFEVPRGETPFSHLSALCWEGARRRYHPLTPAVLRQLAHELDVIERTGLAEFFLICWDLMQFAKRAGIPAQGRGSAADSIVAYVLGVTRVDPIRHELLFERFINEGRTAYPDVDIDFSSARREEVIQYVYRKYGPEHTGMVCNLVTYRARSAVREVGYALGFPRPLVDRVAKALETYDSVMVRRDLEAEGGFAQFFARPDEEAHGGAAVAPDAGLAAASRGLTDAMGQLNHPRGGRIRAGGAPGPAPAGGAPGPAPAIRPSGRADDRGGPGDSPASVAWLRAGRGTGYGTVPRVRRRPGAESGAPLPGDRGGDQPASGTARPEPETEGPPPHRGSVAGLSDWERWLELCARIDGFPRHLSIHSGGMLITATPLIDIVPVERAAMADRVVVQYDKRDVETLKLIKLDLLGLGMLAAIDEAVQLVEHDCAVCLDLDQLPEQIPEVFEMLAAADTVGVFQVESRAQMQTLPKSRPASLDDLVVEVAIIRPGPIQGNAVHPYLRRKQGLEPVTYLHPSLEPILHDTLGVILYQEQVMRIAIDVAGFTPAGSDAFRRAMGTYRSKREMDRLHDEFVGGCATVQGMPEDDAEELFRRVAAFASFGFAKSHAAAFARTAYESSFLRLFYPAQFTAGLVNAQPMGFYPVEVLVNDAKRHGVAVLPVDVNSSTYRTTTEWVGRPGWAMAGTSGDDGSHDDDPGEELPEGCGIGARPRPVRSPACVVPSAAARERWAAESTTGWGVRLGLHLVSGVGEEHAARLDAELARGPYRDLADVVDRTGLAEEVVERLIRAGALDSLGRPRREMLWQLREVAGASRGRVRGRSARGEAGGRAAGRPMALRLPPTDAPVLPPIGEAERLGDAYAVVGLDARRQAVALFRDALEAIGASTNAALAGRRPGPVQIGGLVVTRQHPMTARGTVFLALEDETGMANVTLWPDAWQRWRSIVRRHALLLVDGDLQREGEVVNVIARRVEGLVEATRGQDAPGHPEGVRQLGMAGMRRLG